VGVIVCLESFVWTKIFTRIPRFFYHKG